MEQSNETIIPTLEIDTNAEYISAKGIHDQPPIITSVFRSIFVETPKNFFAGIRNYFQRIYTFFADGIKYLKYPSLKIDPFATKDYKESCQHTFEFVLIVIAMLIFLIKMDWVYGVEDLKKVYNNDISQALMQFFIFIIFAVSYFVLVVLAVLAGRSYRKMFAIPVTRQESDILFVYLNNTLFTITAALAFILRCIVPYENVAGNDTYSFTVLIFYLVVFSVMIYRWAGRFALLNNLKISKRPSFQIVVTIATTLFFAFCSFAITFFIWGV